MVVIVIEGVGIDLLEMNRIKELISRKPDFRRRILTEKEDAHFLNLSKHRQIEFLAGRFAAKEAFSKAYGTGIGAEVSFLDIEVLPDAKNKPILLTNLYSGKIHLSISHTDEFVIAQVILERES